MIEFPKMLYRLGDEIVLEGIKLATLIVHGAEHEAEAIAEGWRNLETALKGEEAKVEAKIAKSKGK